MAKLLLAILTFSILNSTSAFDGRYLSHSFNHYFNLKSTKWKNFFQKNDSLYRFGCELKTDGSIYNCKGQEKKFRLYHFQAENSISFNGIKLLCRSLSNDPASINRLFKASRVDHTQLRKEKIQSLVDHFFWFNQNKAGIEKALSKRLSKLSKVDFEKVIVRTFCLHIALSE